jgi:hypothetical protein
VAYVRTVKTASGATAVQIVYSCHRGSRQIEHLGSAHTAAEVELLKAAARQKLAAGQGELDLGLDAGAPGGPLPITSSRMGCLLDALAHAYDVLGFPAAAGGDEVFFQLAAARVIEPVSKLDSLRVLEEAGVAPVSYPTVNRRLPVYAREGWRQRLSAACAAHARLGRASLVLYDVSTLYFETDAGDGFREPGFSKERRLEPQITIGAADRPGGVPADGVRLRRQPDGDQDDAAGDRGVHGRARLARCDGRGGCGDGERDEPEGERQAAGLSFILGARIPHEPYAVKRWRREHPGEQIPDGEVFAQPWPAGPDGGRRDQVIYYQYKAGRARRTLRGIDEQVAKAEKAVAGQVPVKRNRFIRLTGGTRTVNRDLEAKARSLAGLKGYVTNLAACPDGTPVTPEFVIGSYHQLFQVEKSFRMAKSDLQARPVYHRTRDSIEAHLTIVLAALAVSRWIEAATGWSIRKFVKTTRRYRTIQIQAGDHVITAADPLPADLRDALNKISSARPGTH